MDVAAQITDEQVPAAHAARWVLDGGGDESVVGVALEACSADRRVDVLTAAICAARTANDRGGDRTAGDWMYATLLTAVHHYEQAAFDDTLPSARREEAARELPRVDCTLRYAAQAVWGGPSHPERVRAHLHALQDPTVARLAEYRHDVDGANLATPENDWAAIIDDTARLTAGLTDAQRQIVATLCDDATLSAHQIADTARRLHPAR